MTIEFGDFKALCQTASLVVCPMLHSPNGIEPTCYSRNVGLGGVVFFQPSTFFVHIIAIIMTIIMIVHVRSKYTAVGRKEIVMFFWLYVVVEFYAIFLDTATIPTASPVYPWFTAGYTGLVVATYTCLLVNAFVGFQFAEDGTPLSLWILRGSCFAMFGLTFFISIATFQSIAGFSNMKPLALFILYILFPVVCAFVYLVSQLLLVFKTLDDRWPLGDLAFGAAFWGIGVTILVVFSADICDTIKHYIDGVFFFHSCMLLAVMMVYKYWDSITCEDLEFSVGSKASVWEVKDPFLTAGDFDDEQYSYASGGSTGVPLINSHHVPAHGGYPPS